MGMTIDEAISHLDTYSSTMGSGQTTQAQHEESKRVAIDTMCKYQEQTKHLKALQRRCFALTSGTMCLFCPMECVARKGVEDGNDVR